MLARSLEKVRIKSWALLVVGDGPARNEVMAAFKNFKNVRFLDRCDKPKIAQFSAAADIFVWPAVNEGYGMALLEAQLAGLPIIAGVTPGVAQIVSNNVTGLLTLPGDYQSFANATNALLCDPVGRLVMGKAARNKVQKHHSIAGAAKRLDAVLSNIAAVRMP